MKPMVMRSRDTRDWAPRMLHRGYLYSHKHGFNPASGLIPGIVMSSSNTISRLEDEVWRSTRWTIHFYDRDGSPEAVLFDLKSDYVTNVEDLS